MLFVFEERDASPLLEVLLGVLRIQQVVPALVVYFQVTREYCIGNIFLSVLYLTE